MLHHNCKTEQQVLLVYVTLLRRCKLRLHRSRKHVAVIVLRPLAGPDRMAATMTGMGKK